MTDRVTIALDAMSGDRGPAVAVEAAVRMLGDHPRVSIVLVGQQDVLAPLVRSAAGAPAERLSVHHADEVVAMDEAPAEALRRKKRSSMRLAVDLVRDGTAHACVSAGNTGALMATARFVLKTLPGIERPAILSAIPAIGGHTLMLDLGANADCTPEQLYQFGIMGSVVAEQVQGVDRPRVGLLNIGAEAIKGTDTIRKAATLLEASDVNYVGFVEGDDIFSGSIDVVVSDGFTGNVSLKTMEGLTRLIGAFMSEAFQRDVRSRFVGLLAKPVLRNVRVSLDPRRYNGASLVGLKGIVIKSHGGADSLALANALEMALLEIRRDLPNRIDRHLAPVDNQPGVV